MDTDQYGMDYIRRNVAAGLRKAELELRVKGYSPERARQVYERRLALARVDPTYTPPT